MAGTKAGAAKAVATIRAKKGPNFYAEIGAKGGRNGNTGGFAAGEEGRARARKYGRIGGRISRRGKRADVATKSDYDLAA